MASTQIGQNRPQVGAVKKRSEDFSRLEGDPKIAGQIVVSVESEKCIGFDRNTSKMEKRLMGSMIINTFRIWNKDSGPTFGFLVVFFLLPFGELIAVNSMQ